MASATTMEDMYKNFQILADAKEKAGEVIVNCIMVNNKLQPAGRRSGATLLDNPCQLSRARLHFSTVVLLCSYSCVLDA